MDFFYYKLLSNGRKKRNEVFRWIFHRPTKEEIFERFKPLVMQFLNPDDIKSEDIIPMLALPELVDMMQHIPNISNLLRPLISKHFLPKEGKILYMDACDDLKTNKCVRYNCSNNPTFNGPFEFYMKELNKPEPWDPKLFDRIETLSQLDHYLPEWQRIAAKCTYEQVDRLLNRELLYNLWDQIQFIRLKSGPYLRTEWLSEADHFMKQIFFIGLDVCSPQAEKAWIDLSPEWRCIALCANNMQCTNTTILYPFTVCPIHKHNPIENQISVLTYSVEKNLLLDHAFPFPEDAYILGPYAYYLYYTNQINEMKHVPDQVIVLTQSPPPPPKTDRNDEIPKPLDTFSHPEIERAWTFVYKVHDRKKKRMHVTWLESKDPVTHTLSISGLSLDQFIWYQMNTGLGYMRISNKKEPTKLEFGMDWDRIVQGGLKLFLYTLNRLAFYQSRLYKIENYYTPGYWVESLTYLINHRNLFGTSAAEIIAGIIDYNIFVKMTENIDLPLLLFFLPQDNLTHKWSDVKISVYFGPDKDSYLWRFYPQAPYVPQYQISPIAFQSEEETTLFLNGRLVDVNDILKADRSFLTPKDWELGDVPKMCFDLIKTKERTVFQFVEKQKEKKEDPPYVFFHKVGQEVQSACLKRSGLQAQYDLDESKFYECLKDKMTHASPEQMFIKLSLFANYQTFITKENFDFLIQSDNIYFWIAEKPFYQLQFSTKQSLADNTAVETEQDIELGLGTYVSADHCQAGSGKSIYIIYPITDRTLSGVEHQRVRMRIER